MTEIKRINRKYKKHSHKMTNNDKHRLEMEAAAIIENILQEPIDNDDEE